MSTPFMTLNEIVNIVVSTVSKNEQAVKYIETEYKTTLRNAVSTEVAHAFQSDQVGPELYRVSKQTVVRWAIDATYLCSQMYRENKGDF